MIAVSPTWGNVPVVRMQGREEGRIRLSDWLFARRGLEGFSLALPGRAAPCWGCARCDFLPRPPELISLANLPEQVEGVDPVIVYPDPPLSIEEEGLFTKVAPRVRLRSLMEWVAEVFQ